MFRLSGIDRPWPATREALEARSRAGDEVLDEALARLDVAEAEMGRLRERLARLEEAGPRVLA